MSKITKDDLLDDVDKGKRGASVYEKAQNTAMYIKIAKYIFLVVIFLAPAVVGYNILKDEIAREAVVVAAKKTVDEKIKEAEAYQERITKKYQGITDAEREKVKKEFKTQGSILLKSLSGGLADLAKKVDKNLHNTTGNGNVVKRFHEDAPEYCMEAEAGEVFTDYICKDYTYDEITGDDYYSLKMTVEGSCPDLLKEMKSMIKNDGGITENGQRLLSHKCRAVRKSNENADRDKIKQELMNE